MEAEAPCLEIKGTDHEKFSLMLLERMENLERQHDKKVSLDGAIGQVNDKLEGFSRHLNLANDFRFNVRFLNWALAQAAWVHGPFVSLLAAICCIMLGMHTFLPKVLRPYCETVGLGVLTLLAMISMWWREAP